MKRSRILTFSYNAAVTALFGKTSSDRTMQHAHTLVAELVADRELEDAEERPIIFICHSLGGIIVKRVSPLRIFGTPFPSYSPPPQGLAYSASRTSKLVQHLHSIFVSTYAVLFLGTPHAGSSNASLASTGRKIIDALVPSMIWDTEGQLLVPSMIWDTEGQLLDALQEGSETLQNITDMFAPLMKNFRIYFLWEQEKTDLGTSKDYVRVNQLS